MSHGLTAPRKVDDVVEVEALKLGTQRPARVLIRFVDERFEGRQEWVPPSRLKVRWVAVDTFCDREAKWDRIDELGPGGSRLNSYRPALLSRGRAECDPDVPSSYPEVYLLGFDGNASTEGLVGSDTKLARPPSLGEPAVLERVNVGALGGNRLPARCPCCGPQPMTAQRESERRNTKQ